MVREKKSSILTVISLFPFLKKRNSEEAKIAKFISSKFGYSIKEMFYFNKAFTHKSYANSRGVLSNERLEFLGDSILDAVIAEYLFLEFKNKNEGYLTKVKAKLVSRKTLSKIAREMELSTFLKFNKSRSINIATIEGNAFEAIIGAIYLDGGYKAAKKSVLSYVLKNYINLNEILEEDIDFKSKLYIWSQKNKVPIRFIVVDEEQRNNSWIYTVKVYINEQEFGMGKGSSKKNAEQAAAKETIELIG